MAPSITHPGFLTGGWRQHVFEPFHPGVEICRLHDEADGSAVAMLRYAKGASVPRHLHQGIETILVLEGSQTDDAGRYGEGALVINPIGTSHAVASEGGCVVLIIWARPVAFI
ncbi:MAG: cupin domain-containing protein [Alphaproteobacteria bacterium]|nr:cupin domain-containing protein [Alphaproteobacteria bacterium]